LFFILSVNGATAANKYVNNAYSSTEDVYTTAAGNDATGNGSASAPYATLSKAVSMAASGDTIYIDSGSFLTHSITFGKNLTIIGAGTAKTILSGNNTENIFGSFGSATTLTFRSLQFYSYGKNVDGQILTVPTGKTLNLESVVLNDNPGDASAGVSFLLQSGSITNASYSVFKCSGYNADNGGVFSVTAGTLAISNSIFFNNRNKIDKGGAIEIQGNATVTVSNTNFKKNVVDDNGGAIYQNGGTLTVTGSCFDNNMTTGDNTTDGGGAYMGASGTATFTNCTFSNNETNNNFVLTSSTSPDGGAIRISGATASFNICSFTNNHAGFSTSTLGEDIAVTSGTCNLTNCRFETIYTTYSNDVNIYKSGGTLNMVKSGTASTNGTGVVLTKPEINGTATTNDGLSPDASPTTNCSNLGTIACGPVTCATDVTAPSIVTCVASKSVSSCTLLDYRSEIVAYDDCSVNITQSPAAGSVLSVGSNTITLTVADSNGNSSSCTFTVTVDAILGGSLSGGASVCSGTNSTVLTLNGNTGSVSKWQYSTTSDFSSNVTDVANTTSSLTAINLSATTYYRAVVSNGSCASVNSDIATITMNNSSVVAGNVTGSATVCSGSNSTVLTLSGNEGTIVKWQSSISSDFSSSVTDIANVTSTFTASDLTATTYYRAVVSGDCGSSNSSSATIAVNAVSVGGSVSGGATVCSGTNSTVLTLSGNVGSVTKWQYSNDDFSSDIHDVASTSTTLTVTNLSSSRSYRAVVKSGVCSSEFSADAMIIIGSSSIGGIGTISGLASVCGQTSSTYSIPVVSGATNYVWTLPAGLSVHTSAGNSLVVNIDELFNSGVITVKAYNQCATTVAKSLLVIRKPKIAFIQGPVTTCGITTATYNAAVISGATYAWTVPSGMTITSGQGTSTIQVAIASNYTNGLISLTATNPCGKSDALVYEVNAIQRPTVINGLANIANATSGTYSTPNISGASYVWTVPTGVSINSGQGTNSINVAFSGAFSNGTIGVALVYTCGTSVPRTIDVNRSKKLSTILGPDVICGLSEHVYDTLGNQVGFSPLQATYTVARVSDAVRYQWILPVGATIVSGQGTNEVVLSFNMSTFVNGNLSVLTETAYGSSPLSSLYIQRVGGSITASNTELCSVSTATYSIPSTMGTGFTWNVPSYMTITSGQGTNAITVSIDNPYFRDNVTVSFLSNCERNESISINVGCNKFTKVRDSQCGTTLPAINSAVYPNPLAGAQAYKYEVTNGASVRVFEQVGSLFNLTELPGGVLYGTTYSIKVAAKIDGVWGDFGVACNITTPSVGSKVRARQCGISLGNIMTAIYADAVIGAQSYRFEVTNGAEVRTVERVKNLFNLTELAGGALYSTTYSIRVAVKVANSWGAYGTSCDVTTPGSPFSKVVDALCGKTLVALNSAVYNVAINGAQAYKFEVTLDGDTEVYELTSGLFNLTMLSGGASYSSTYSIRVATKINGFWGGYGTSCDVNTPAAITKVKSVHCGTTLAAINTPIYADLLIGAQAYRFEISDGSNVKFVERTKNLFNLTDMLGGATYNTTYTIRVAVKVNDVWGDYGTSCTVTSPSLVDNAARVNASAISSNFDAKAYPSPFTESFKINAITLSDEKVEIQVYDMIGKLLEVSCHNVSDLEFQEIGQNYQTGVYNVVVIQGDSVKTLRVLKK